MEAQKSDKLVSLKIRRNGVGTCSPTSILVLEEFLPDFTAMVKETDKKGHTHRYILPVQTRCYNEHVIT